MAKTSQVKGAVVREKLQKASFGRATRGTSSSPWTGGSAKVLKAFPEPEQKDDDEEASEGDEVLGDHCPFCQSANEPTTGTACQHHVGWKRDDPLDLGNDLEKLKRAWDDVCALVDEHGGDLAFKRLVADEVGADADRQQLFDLASYNTDFSDLMDRVHIRRG
jgi:hypothetical protein